MQLVEVEVMRLGLDRSTNSYVVILQEKGGSRLLPIWIGQPEAESIVIEMNKLKRERPLTHDLCKNLIIGMGGTLKRVHITKVENRTFYAELHITRSSGAVHIDAQTGAESRWDPGPRYSSGEWLFVATGSDEAEGVVMTYVYDHAADTSSLVVLDARDPIDAIRRSPTCALQVPRSSNP